MELTIQKNLFVRYDVDVCIAGGGPAGVAAAVAAARCGASVFLAESSGSFGGAATVALVPAFMQFTDGVHFVADGIGREIRDAIRNSCPEDARPYCPDGIPVETLKLCYDQLVAAAGVQFRFFTTVIDVVRDGNRITHVVCSGKGENFAVCAKVFIDCTGDGDLCAMAGAPYEQGDENGETMAATLCGLWNGIRWQDVVRPDSRRLDDAFADHIFTNEDRHLPGMWPVSKSVGGSNAGHIYGVDGTQADSLTQAMLAGRRQLQEYRRYYREYLTGYEQAELVVSASQIGIRETRRIQGDYQLKLQDFLDRAVFKDEIGRYCYPVDVHSSRNTSSGYQKYENDFANLRYQKGDSYGIPYRSLTVTGLDNTLTAGRCISADRSMQASVRVMPGCFITGQASGCAAALAAKGKGDTRGVSIHQLQQQLKRLGAYLPNVQGE